MDTATTKESAPEQDKSYNIFRDSSLRYAGYANEVGESFRYQFPKAVMPSYVIAFGYCCADAASTGCGVFSASNLPEEQKSVRVRNAIRATADTLLWQSLASVMIPGVVINLTVKASRFAVRRSPVILPLFFAEWVPTATGLGSIPFIVKPIDQSVDSLLDNSTRRWWKEDNRK